MHYKESGFSIPRSTARRNSEHYNPATTNRVNIQFFGRGANSTIGGSELGNPFTFPGGVSPSSSRNTFISPKNSV